MKRTILIATLVIMGLAAGAATWTSDKAHSRLGFSISQLMISEVDGSFQNFTATIRSEKPDFTDAIFELSADVSSISTGNKRRDNHLRKPDFFDAARYPTITFRSTGLRKTGDRNYKLAGNLTMHGVTKPVTLDAVLVAQRVHPASGKAIVGFKVTGSLKRLDYGVGKGSGTATMSDAVEIVASGEFIQE